MRKMKILQKKYFSSRLREKLISSGMTQVQLAAAADCDQSAISGYLKGRIPSGDKLIALARALGCTAESLLSESSKLKMRETPPSGYGERWKKDTAHVLRLAAKKLREEAAKLETQADLLDSPRI